MPLSRVDHEPTQQGQKRDAEEAELPEAPSRGGRDGPPEPRHPDDVLWVKNVTKRAADWLKRAPEIDRRRFMSKRFSLRI